MLATLELPDEREEDDEEEAWLLSEDALNRLINLGLLQQESDGTLLLHRLLTLFVRERTNDSNPQAAVERVLLTEAERLNEAGYPAPLQAWQPHLHHLTDAATKREDELAANLCNAMGYHLNTVADYKNARPYFERALAIREKVLGEEHSDTATKPQQSGRIIAGLWGSMRAPAPTMNGLWLSARRCWERNIHHTAGSLNNLGLLLHAQGQYESARPYYERALAIYEKVLGEEHPLTATSLNNLGDVIVCSGAV